MLRAFFAFTLTLAFIATSITNSYAAADNAKVAVDEGGQVITSTKFGTCVRTKWEGSNDACGTAPAPEPTPAPPPAPVAAPAPKPAPIVRTQLNSAEKAVYFNLNSDQLTTEAQNNLRSLAAKLKDAKDVVSADIVGFADRLGSVEHNEALSVRRANAVKDFLAQEGYINTQVAAIRGLGESAPITNCPTKASRKKQIFCLAADRRVEVELKYNEETVISQ